MVKPNLSRKKRDKRKEKTRKQKYKYIGGSQGTIPPTNKEKLLEKIEQKAEKGHITMGKNPNNARNITKKQAIIAEELKKKFQKTSPNLTKLAPNWKKVAYKTKQTKQTAKKQEEVNAEVVEEDNEKLEKTKGILLKIKKLLGSTRLLVGKIYHSEEVDLQKSNHELIKYINELRKLHILNPPLIIGKKKLKNKKKEIIQSIISEFDMEKSLNRIINILRIYSEQYKEGEEKIITEILRNVEMQLIIRGEKLKIIREKLNGQKVQEIEEKVIEEIEQLILKELKIEELAKKFKKSTLEKFGRINRELKFLYKEININVNHPEIKSLSAAQEEVEKSMKELDRELEFLRKEININVTSNLEKSRRDDLEKLEIQLKLLKAEATALKTKEAEAGTAGAGTAGAEAAGAGTAGVGTAEPEAEALSKEESAKEAETAGAGTAVEEAYKAEAEAKVATKAKEAAVLELKNKVALLEELIDSEMKLEAEVKAAVAREDKAAEQASTKEAEAAVARILEAEKELEEAEALLNKAEAHEEKVTTKAKEAVARTLEAAVEEEYKAEAAAKEAAAKEAAKEAEAEAAKEAVAKEAEVEAAKEAVARTLETAVEEAYKAEAAEEGSGVGAGTTTVNAEEKQQKLYEVNAKEKKSQNPVNFFAPVLLIVLIGFVSVN